MLFENLDGNIQKMSNEIIRLDTKANGTFQKTLDLVYLMLLLSGSFYFAIRGLWSHALVYAVLAIATFGVIWFIFLLLAPDVRKQSIQRLLSRDRFFVTSQNVK